ncbi:MAG TPA: energy transducer TonB [Thermoanaerobaculia bacterium]|nr:energy transducer TonB [Thermoanaerobaculia bacterium]
MSRAVEHVLAQRARRTGRRPEAASLIAALALHGLVVAAAWALPRLQEPPKPPEYMPVTIIPAQALGVPRPAPPRPRPAPPAPEPVVAEPEPAPTPEPEPEPPAPEPEDVPVLPKKEPEKKPEKKPEPARATETGRKPPETPKKPEPRRPTPSQTTAAGTGEPEDRGDQTGRRGSATGNPLGTTAFGSEIAGLDNPDFTYGYYLDRLLSLINDKWERPSLGSGIRAIISFRIERDGRMTDLRVSESSGYNTFDLAAMRAVQNASPFPPLPRAYRHDSLGVNLIVR